VFTLLFKSRTIRTFGNPKAESRKVQQELKLRLMAAKLETQQTQQE
jgi:hypothetical protein